MSVRYSAIPPAAKSEVIPVISTSFFPGISAPGRGFSLGSCDQRLNYDTTRAGIQATGTPFLTAAPMLLRANENHDSQFRELSRGAAKNVTQNPALRAPGSAASPPCMVVMMIELATTDIAVTSPRHCISLHVKQESIQDDHHCPASHCHRTPQSDRHDVRARQ